MSVPTTKTDVGMERGKPPGVIGGRDDRRPRRKDAPPPEESEDPVGDGVVSSGTCL